MDMKFDIVYARKYFQIGTVPKDSGTQDLMSIFETLQDDTSMELIEFYLMGRGLDEEEYADSLNDIALFIDGLVNNKIHLNFTRMEIYVDRYDNGLINVFHQISRLIKTCKISSLAYESLVDPNDVKFGSQEMRKLLASFLCSQPFITDLKILHDKQLPDVHCLGHFKNLTINFSRTSVEHLEPFLENFCSMLHYNQNIKLLQITRLPVGLIDKILDALSINDSVEEFYMPGNNDDYITLKSLINMIVNNRSITKLNISLPREYEKLLEALTYNDTLRKITLRPGRFPYLASEEGFLSDLNAMLDTNFTLTDIESGSFQELRNQNIVMQIREKLARNMELVKDIRFARIKPIF